MDNYETIRCPECSVREGDGTSLGELSRRNFLTLMGGIALASALPSRLWRAQKIMPQTARRHPGKRELVIKPVLTYAIPQRIEATSWRSWGGLQSEANVNTEIKKIQKELGELSKSVDFSLSFLPLSPIAVAAQVAQIKDVDAADVILIYPAGGWLDIFEALAALRKSLIFFVRHKSGPYYLWHEIIDSRFLRQHTDELLQPGIDFQDVVIDDYAEIAWRLRALYGLKNTLGRRIVAIGGPGAWSGGEVPIRAAREKWQLDIVTVPIPEVANRVETARKDRNFMKQTESQATKYLQQEGISLHTDKRFVVDAFVLEQIFKEILKEFGAYAITVGGCMGGYARIMPCLPLSLLNDEDYMAYCESDFVVIPAGILLHFISGKPTFFCNPTYPHKGTITLAHCTAPRRMDGKTYEKTKILTHFESDWGAAPKVEMRKKQLVTIIKPDFSAKHWLGFKGEIVNCPFLPICRSQIEVKILGNWRLLIERMRGFHCMVAYGDYLKEIGYALKKVSVNWEIIS